MSDSINPTKSKAKRSPAPEIPLPDGDRLIMRSLLAKRLRVHERTLRRWNLKTVHVGPTPYVLHDQSMREIADSAKRKNEPTKGRRRG
jgi:hypothetical protein